MEEIEVYKYFVTVSVAEEESGMESLNELMEMD